MNRAREALGPFLASGADWCVRVACARAGSPSAAAARPGSACEHRAVGPVRANGAGSAIAQLPGARGSIGYRHDGILPSLSLTYSRDLKRANVVLPGGGPQPANDRDGLTVGLGLSIYGVGGNKGLTIGLAATTELLRRDLRNTSLSLNVRLAI